MIQQYIRIKKKLWNKRSIAGALIFLFIFSIVIGAIPHAAATLTVDRSYYSTTADGYIYSLSEDYVSANDAYSGIVDNSAVSMLGGQEKYGDVYNVARLYVYFDTSNIPDGANITSATLRLYCVQDASQTDFNVTIQGTATYPHVPLVESDFYRGFYGTTNFGQRDTSDGLSDANYWNITINAEGLADQISKTGTTRFMLRSDRDYTYTPPSSAEFVYFAAREMGETYAPKLYVTYEVGSGGSNTYSYYIKGPYTDDGDVYNGTVSCRLNPSYSSSIFFDLQGVGGTAAETSYSLEQQGVSMSWNISESGNYTRVHYFTDDTTETIYVFVPEDNTPFYLYSFQVNDFVGVTNGFLENLVYVDGISRVVERQPINSINAAPFYMTWGTKYDMRVVCDQGVLSMGAFTALGESSPALLIPIGAFPSAVEGMIVSVSATRTNGTNIDVDYLDTDDATYWVTTEIYHYLSNGTAVTDYSETINDQSTYSLSWNEADPAKDYMVHVQAYRNGETKDWSFAVPNLIKTTTNFWAFLSGLGSGLPFDLQYLPAIIIVVACLLAFSVWHISVGAWTAWFTAAIMFILGWLPYDGTITPVAMGVAAIICAGVSIGEFKRGERTL